MGEIIKDFDKIVPEKRVAILAGEEIDVSKIPTRVTIELAKLKDRKDELSDDVKGFEKTLEIIALACKSNPKINADFLIDNTDFEQLMDFIDFILEPITKRTEKNIPKAQEIKAVQ